MRVEVHFYSYFRDLAGCEAAVETLPDGAVAADLLAALHRRFPRLAPMEKSTLIAVGVEYRGREEVLRDGDEVSLFPPVQGG